MQDNGIQNTSRNNLISNPNTSTRNANKMNDFQQEEFLKLMLLLNTPNVNDINNNRNKAANLNHQFNFN